jgi:hypothetical protein
MILQGKPNQFLTRAVGVEAGMGVFPLFSTLLRLFLRRSRILDVAHDFPHCEAVAVDLVPMQSM